MIFPARRAVNLCALIQADTSVKLCAASRAVALATDLNSKRCLRCQQFQPQLQSQHAAQITSQHWIWLKATRGNRKRVHQLVPAVVPRCCASFGTHCTTSIAISVQDPRTWSSWSAARPTSRCPRSSDTQCVWINRQSERATSSIWVMRIGGKLCWIF